MGSDVEIEIVAWNDDGSAALIETRSSRDGDRGLSYGVISAHDATDDAAVTATIHVAPGDDTEQISEAECTRAMLALATSVSANRFHHVAVRPARCRGAHRDPVSISGALAPTIWPALPQGRPAGPLEQAALDVLRLEDPHYQTVALDDDCTKPGDAGWALDVAARSEKLVLVVRTSRCNSPTKMSISAYVPSKTGYISL